MSQEIIKFEVVAAIIIKDRKVLMCRSRGNELYYCPGGKLEPGETEFDAIIRECKEELDIDLIYGSIKKYSRFEADAYGFTQPRIVVMNCYQFEYTGEIKASAEIDDIFWASSMDSERLAPAARVLLEQLVRDSLVL
ncbi:MAG: NUDIX domain-containing protein [Cyanobacteria bacterium]|nr:NUDIX domain-containing protein [Cyanobacteriota bacterium]MDA1020778.1 NUDIX domain-containing protein [Cyanobacteriota bacterium]